jgi:hypothetical protein
MAQEAAKIEVFGVNGKYFLISGEEELPGGGKHSMGDEGVILRPKLEGAIDAPVKSLWLPGAFGQVFVDFRWERRDIVFTVQTFDPFEDTPEGWEEVDSDWRFAFDYVKQTQIRYTSKVDPDNPKDLFVRLLEEPKAYSSDAFEGKDPHLWNTGSVVMTCAAELPFYVGETKVYEFTSALATGEHTFDVAVDGDVPVWPRWVLSDNARWTLPDRSYGNEEYGRGVADAAREVQLPLLPVGVGAVADSDPRKQTLIASDHSHLQGRWGGKDLLYPIPATYQLSAEHTTPVTVKWADAPAGVAVRLEVPQWFTRPWSFRSSMAGV